MTPQLFSPGDSPCERTRIGLKEQRISQQLHQIINLKFEHELKSIQRQQNVVCNYLHLTQGWSDESNGDGFPLAVIWNWLIVKDN
jgi:hypothetical protein